MATPVSQHPGQWACILRLMSPGNVQGQCPCGEDVHLGVVPIYHRLYKEDAFGAGAGKEPPRVWPDVLYDNS